MKKKVYIASSWKNRHAVEMLTALLRDLGYEVLSFIEREANTHETNFVEWMHSQDGKDAFSFDIHSATTADWVIYIGPSSIDTWAQIGAAWANNRIIVGLYAHGEQSGLMRLMISHWFDNYKSLLLYMAECDAKEAGK